MELKKINYSQFRDAPGEWILDGLTLGKINLLVGKNASGKTRTLNVINGLANLLSGKNKVQYQSGTYEMEFMDNGDNLKYNLSYIDAKIILERFTKNNKILLERGIGGSGKIFAEKEEKDIDFQTPEDELASVARQDSVQHSFLEPLKRWGDSVYHFAFGDKLGKESFAVFRKNQTKKNSLDLKDTTQVVAVYKKGNDIYPEHFATSIRNDMKTIGYVIDDISIAPPVSINITYPIIGDAMCICVKERDLNNIIDQYDMSQGMFRALSVIIQVNYLNMSKKTGCMLVDDIGEGLDFERSCALIELLMDKADKSSFQLVMSTNDRFVMNKVPLEYWALIERKGSQCNIHNYENSKQVFDDFKMTGMNNFDFFAVDYIQEQPINE
jgi:energy-coupling factor transporter ATP-binding protein EcfA2